MGENLYDGANLAEISANSVFTVQNLEIGLILITK
jgi:hypothetical protein